MTSILTFSQAKHIKGAGKTAARSKYGNKKVVVDGERFDSQLEAKHWHQLKLLERAGQIYGLDRQHRFKLIAPGGMHICDYTADFAFWDKREDRFRVLDSKGVLTDVFRLKKKLMKAFLGIEVECVGKGGL